MFALGAWGVTERRPWARQDEGTYRHATEPHSGSGCRGLGRGGDGQGLIGAPGTGHPPPRRRGERRRRGPGGWRSGATHEQGKAAAGSAGRPRWRLSPQAAPLSAAAAALPRRARNWGSAATPPPAEGGAGAAFPGPISGLHFLSPHRGSPAQPSPRSRPISAAPPRPAHRWEGPGGTQGFCLRSPLPSPPPPGL